MTTGASKRDQRVGARSTRANSWLAWSLAVLSLVLCGAGVVLYVYLPFLAFPLVGALIASRRPENPIGWICLAVGILWMLAIMSGSYARYGLQVASPGSVPFPAAIG